MEDCRAALFSNALVYKLIVLTNVPIRLEACYNLIIFLFD